MYFTYSICHHIADIELIGPLIRKNDKKAKQKIIVQVRLLQVSFRVVKWKVIF